jgi:hypothetical protein
MSRCAAEGPYGLSWGNSVSSDCGLGDCRGGLEGLGVGVMKSMIDDSHSLTALR